MGGITVEPVDNDGGLRAFLSVPQRLYRGDEFWLPPLRRDQRALLSSVNPFFAHAKARLFLARRDREIVGRVAAIVDNRHLERWGEQVGFFGFFESMPDQEVASVLLNTTRAWVRAQGMALIRGPVNPSINHECGLLVEGFNSPPRLLMPYNPPYYSALLEGIGLKPVQDLLSYEADLPDELPDCLVRVARVAESRGVSVRSLNPRVLREEISLIRVLYNDAWRENWGFIPISEEEATFMASRLRPFLVPDLGLIAECGGRPVGFALSLPDYNPALRLLRGRTTPWGLLRFLLRRRSLDEFRVLAFGLLPSYRRRGIDALLIRGTFDAARRRGFRRAELSWILEHNTLMRQTAERLGARVTKRYRLYEAPV